MFGLPPTTPKEVVTQVIANWSNPEYMRLHGGEMTAQEVRTVRAVLSAVKIQILEGLPY